MTPRLRVLVVAPHAVMGGQEQWLLQLLDATDRLEVSAVLLQDGPLREALEQRGVAVDVLPVGTRPVDLPVPVARLARLLRRRRPDVVLANGVKAQFVAGPAARLAGVPEVFVRHDHAFEGQVARLARLADRVVATTEEVAVAVGRDDVVVVHPPLPPVRPLPREQARAALHRLGVPDDGLLLGMLTRLIAYKGVDDAVRALALPGADGWRLVVAGGADPADPGERDRLEAVARQAGVADRVHLLGFVPDAAALVGGLDALAVLTKTGRPGDPGREGFGMTALEAMTAGVPVVAVGGGAIERRLDGAAGLVVGMADPAGVAQALSVLTDPADRAARGARAVALVADHPDAARSADRLCAVLAAAARRPGAGREPQSPVSVVVPVHDEGDGVDAVVGAVLGQLRDGDELVVVDDASRDDTRARLTRLAALHPALRPLHLEVNGGAAAARNAGVAGARHELVACTDAGNALPTGWLDGLRTALEDAVPADLVMGAYLVSTHGPGQQAMSAALYPDLQATRFPGPLVRLHGRLFGRTFTPDRPAGRSLAFRRSAFDRVGGFPAHLRAAEDTAFGLAVARDGACVLQTDAPVVWEQHATLRATARMYVSYGRGDGLQGEPVAIARNAVRAAAAAAVVPVFTAGGPRARVAAALGAAAYAGLPAWQLTRAPATGPAADRARAVALVPVVLLVKDLAKAWGCARGLREAARERS